MSASRSRLFAVVAAGLVAAAVDNRAARAEPARREVVVFEAASLEDAFARIARRFEAENSGVTVVVEAAGTQELRAQLEHGARADVFASADRKHMDALAAEGLVGAPAIFACNDPIVVVRAGLTSAIKTLSDLPRAERIVVGAPDVPIGGYTRQILDNAAAQLGADYRRRVEAKIVSRELNVRQVLAKVVLGEADAGVVYRSDALAARGKVGVVAIPPELNVRADYPVAALAAAPHPDLARRFVALVLSPASAVALREAGFVPCPTR